jgi:hypothetical protein
MHMHNKNDIWFPAKRYGYGWGLPVRWQGWLILTVYAALLLAGLRLLVGGRHPAYFALYQMALGAVLIAICAWKGETPRWRWGGK